MWNKIIAFVGPTGSGKSHEAARMFGECERAAVYQVVRQDMAFIEKATDFFDGDLKEFCLALVEQDFKIVYRVQDGSEEIAGNKFLFPDFDGFLQCCFAREQMTVVVDEAHFVCSAHYMPARLRKAVVTGRHMYLNVFYITQSLAMVHKDLRLNTHEFRFWHITEPADLDAIAERCGNDIAEKVSSLRRAEDNRASSGEYIPGQMLVWNSHTKESTIYDMRSLQERRTNSGVRPAHASAPAGTIQDNGDGGSGSGSNNAVESPDARADQS
jgi:hypothetical protein